MSTKQNAAIEAIDTLLHNLNKSKSIPKRDIINFYNKVETKYDSNVEGLEDILFEEIEDKDKFDKLKKISNLLEMNIF